MFHLGSCLWKVGWRRASDKWWHPVPTSRWRRSIDGSQPSLGKCSSLSPQCPLIQLRYSRWVHFYFLRPILISVTCYQRWRKHWTALRCNLCPTFHLRTNRRIIFSLQFQNQLVIFGTPHWVPYWLVSSHDEPRSLFSNKKVHWLFMPHKTEQYVHRDSLFNKE